MLYAVPCLTSVWLEQCRGCGPGTYFITLLAQSVRQGHCNRTVHSGDWGQTPALGLGLGLGLRSGL